MSTQHTPGPWFPVYEPDGDEDSGVISWEPSGEFVAGDPASDNYVSLSKPSNANLIAAAPELLAALKAAVNAGIIDVDGEPERARAAIAKAEGRS